MTSVAYKIDTQGTYPARLVYMMGTGIEIFSFDVVVAERNRELY